MAIDKEVLDKRLANDPKPADIVGEKGRLKPLTKALVARALEAELTPHLGYEKHNPAGDGSGNSRNRKSQKKLTGDFGEIDMAVRRDRHASFEPPIVPKGQTRFTGFDDKSLSMYARGMTTRDSQSRLEEIYGVEVSPTLICNLSAAVMDEVRPWQSRSLEPLYPIVCLDALMVKRRDNGVVQNRAVYAALGVTREGRKEVLGLWSSVQEGAQFWRQVWTELKNRGLQDIFLAGGDGRNGFPQAMETVYRQTTVQRCIAHLVRGSLP